MVEGEKVTHGNTEQGSGRPSQPGRVASLNDRTSGRSSDTSADSFPTRDSHSGSSAYASSRSEAGGAKLPLLPPRRYSFNTLVAVGFVGFALGRLFSR